MRAIASLRIVPVDDQLRHQRIVVRRNHAFGVGGGVDANADSAWQIQPGDLAGRRYERLRMFGIDAAFDRVTTYRRLGCGRSRAASAGGNQNLRLDDIDPGDGSVTGCSTWIRAFTSMKYSLPFLIHQELDCSGIGVADVAHRLAKRLDRRARSSGVTAGEGASSISF